MCIQFDFHCTGAFFLSTLSVVKLWHRSSYLVFCPSWVLSEPWVCGQYEFKESWAVKPQSDLSLQQAFTLCSACSVQWRRVRKENKGQHREDLSGAEDVELRTWPQLERTLPRLSPQEGGRWSGWEGCLFLVPFPPEYCSDDYARQRLTVD